MPYNPARHHRRSVRLRGWDYASAGPYFVTLCVKNRECLFGDVVRGEMQLNEFGNIVRDEWNRTTDIRHEIALDLFVVMPNHIHGIVWIHTVGSRRGIRPDAPTDTATTLPITIKHGPDNRSLGAFVAGFKSITTKCINELRDTPGLPVWQRNYHEHIIRNDDELNRIRQYIADNPRQWESDLENPPTKF